MSLEIIIQQINAMGWQVNNLFQRRNGEWQANLWRASDAPDDRAGYSAFAVDPHPEAALRTAYESAMAAWGSPPSVDAVLEALL